MRPYSVPSPSSLVYIHDDELAQLMSCFGVGSWSRDDAKGRSLAGNGTSAKAVLDIGRERVLVKKAPWYVSDDVRAVRAVARLQAGLARSGRPAPALMVTKAGEELVELGPDRCFTAQAVIEGRGFEATESDCHAAGRSIRSVHEAFRLMDDSETSRGDLTNWSLLETVRSSVERVRVASRSPAILESCSVLSEMICELDADYEQHDEALATPTHGDYNPGNLVFPFEGELPVIVDFDNCTLDDPRVDLARFLAHLLFVDFSTQTLRFSSFNPNPEIGLGHHFLAGYGSSHRPACEPVTVGSLVAAAFVELKCLGFLNGWSTVDEFTATSDQVPLVVAACRSLVEP